jgi:4-amino-4-deoxy-L-arabinose transferase-like glycosyltransferase
LVLAAVRRVRMMRAPSLAHGPDEQPRWGEGATRLSLLERPLLATLLLAVTVYALITTADLAGRATVLEGGQDWLTYESYARDIQLNGLLMTLGEPLGKGKPFFFQPFYPYSLALMHWLTGEGVWGPTVLQLMGLGVAAALVYELGKRLFGAAAGLVALLLFLGLGLSQLDWIARKLLSENLYFVVLPAALLFLARAIDERRLPDLAWAGLLFGVASVTRAPTLLFMPGAALVLVLAWRRAGRSLNRIAAGFAVLALCTTAVAALVPIRNYIVSGKPALVASNGGATLLLAHQPTDRVSLRGVDRNPLYNRLNLDRATREVVEFARQDPVGYFWTLVPLGLYSVGVSGAVEGHPPVAPDILLITGLYAVAVLVLPAARTLRTWPLHIFIVLHFGIMITFLPYVYGYRQVLPMQQLMLVFDGLLLVMVIRRLLLRRGAESPGQPLLEQRPA